MLWESIITLKKWMQKKRNHSPFSKVSKIDNTDKIDN